jgi:hypothetical protein
MIADALNTFCSSTSLNTGAAGTYDIGDVIDLGVTSPQRNIGAGEKNLWLVIAVDTTATSGGAATLRIDLATSASADMSTPTSIVSTPTYAVANLTAGTRLMAVALPSTSLYKRYIGIKQVTGTAAFTAGKIDAFITSGLQDFTAYSDGIPSL